MSEEELKVIEHLEYWVEYHIKHKTPVSPYSITCVGKALNLIEKQQKEIENIKKEVQEHIAFENRLKRDGTEPDLFNQGRFYVANNIKDILDGKEKI